MKNNQHKEIERLNDLVNVLLNSWKNKHPDDFKHKEDMKINSIFFWKNECKLLTKELRELKEKYGEK